MLFWLLLLAAQQTTTPSFDPNDPEGLVLSPNGSSRFAFKRKVMWKSRIDGIGNYVKAPPPTAAERQANLQNLKALTALFMATPTGSSGEGFWVNASMSPFGSNETDAPPGVALNKLPHRYKLGLYPFYHEDDRLPNGQWRLSVAGETKAAFYEFNTLPGRLSSYLIASEPRDAHLPPLEYFPQPSQIATFHGLPVYETGFLVVSRPGRPLWIPASLERTLRAAMPKLEGDLRSAERRLAAKKKEYEQTQAPEFETQAWEHFEKNSGNFRTTNPAKFESRRAATVRSIADARQRAAAAANPGRNADGAWYWNPKDALERAVALLNSLTPETAHQPACWVRAPLHFGQSSPGRYQLEGDIVPLGTPGCKPIVVSNLNYFDFNLPRSTPQLLTIPDFYRCGEVQNGVYKAKFQSGYRAGDPPEQGCHRHVSMWQELDWQKFSQLVIP